MCRWGQEGSQGDGNGINGVTQFSALRKMPDAGSGRATSSSGQPAVEVTKAYVVSSPRSPRQPPSYSDVVSGKVGGVRVRSA